MKVNGQAALIAVASGLKGDLTGRDNIELKCLMLGFSKQEIDELEPDIIEFSELGSFIDQPVKSYSSGMKSRLGFAISVNVDPDILIIDEALSVGDKAFAEKSLAKMKEFKQQGKTMIFVSHSIGQMKQFCEKILWLEFGRVKAHGPVQEVMPKYEAFLKKWQKMSKAEREAYKSNAADREAGGHLEQETIGAGEANSEPAAETGYTVQLTSRLGHLKGGQSYIYPEPDDEADKTISEGYKNSVYYIKRQELYQDETFYLLSKQPSADTDTVGWMNARDLTTHPHVVVDCDVKTFYLTGTGQGYSRPWGGRKNSIFHDLSQFKNTAFQVDRTELVRNNVWYRGTLHGKQVWVHHKQVKETPDEEAEQ